MLFKNAQIYRLPDNWNPSVDMLNSALAKNQFTSPGEQDHESRGWVPASTFCGLGDLVHSQGENHLICLQTETKILPSSVVNQIAAERAEELAEQQGYKLGRKQMNELRENIAKELLPKAFSRKRKTFALIVSGLLIVDSASQSKAEDMLEHLRHTLDNFPLTLLRTELSPMSAMAGWLAGGEAPEGFTYDMDCTLRSISEDRREVAYRRGLNEEQVRENLEGGCLPIKLAMTYDDRVSFVLTEKMEIKRLQYLDIVTESLRECEDAVDLFESEFAINATQIPTLVWGVVRALGGELHQS